MSNERSPRADCSTTMGTSGIAAILSTTAWLSQHHSNHLVVNHGAEIGMSVRREVEIEASPEEVWDALATEEGRERWLEEDPQREIHVEVADEPSRLVWWWWRGEEPATRVELLVVAAPAGSRVVVVESRPTFPLVALASALAVPSRLLVVA